MEDEGKGKLMWLDAKNWIACFRSDRCFQYSIIQYMGTGNKRFCSQVYHIVVPHNFSRKKGSRNMKYQNIELFLAAWRSDSSRVMVVKKCPRFQLVILGQNRGPLTTQLPPAQRTLYVQYTFTEFNFASKGKHVYHLWECPPSKTNKKKGQLFSCIKGFSKLWSFCIVLCFYDYQD